MLIAKHKRNSMFRTGAIAKNRLEAFSDGVLAFVITLLVLEVKLPADLGSETEIWNALVRLAPAFLAWVVSFFFVLVFWVNHHYLIASLKHADRGLLWLNGLFLLCITSTPFPTGLVGEYPGTAPPLVLLSGSMLLTSLSLSLMRYYASFVGLLLHDQVSLGERRTAMIQSLTAPALYALALVLAFVWKHHSPDRCFAGVLPGVARPPWPIIRGLRMTCESCPQDS
jgi:uncharacterized membrane protein